MTRQNFNRGIIGTKLSQIKFQQFVNIFGTDAVNSILNCVPILYYFILYANKAKLDSMFSVFKSALISNLKKNELNNIINSLTYSNNNYEAMTKSDLLELLITTIQQPRSLSNTFIDDIFKPEYVLNYSYDSSNYRNIFTTSFYYLLKCKFNSVDIPLLKNHHFDECTFPFDIDPIEWLNPTVIIDVTNQFYDVKNLIDPTTGAKFPMIGSLHNTRREYLFRNCDGILDALFKKQYFDHPNMLVLFVHPSDNTSGTTCTEILDIMSELKNKAILIGDATLPLNRKALYISIPCNLFLPPDLDEPETMLVRKPFHPNLPGSVIPVFEDGTPMINWNHNGEMRQIKRGTIQDLQSLELMDSYKYDKYGKVLKANAARPSMGLYTFPSNDSFYGYNTYYHRGRSFNLRGAIIPKYDYTQTNTRDFAKPIDKFKSKIPAPIKASRSPSKANLIQGSNTIMQRLVQMNSHCSHHTNLHKNELDDYMIALIMYLRAKTISELMIPIPYLYKCVLFTNDYYDWINDSIYRTAKVIRPCLYTELLEPALAPRSKITFLNFLFDKENYQLKSPIVETNPKYNEFWSSLNMPDKIACTGLTPHIYDHFYRLITRFNINPVADQVEADQHQYGQQTAVAGSGGSGGGGDSVHVDLGKRVRKPPKKDASQGYSYSKQQQQMQDSYQLLKVPTMISSPKQEQEDV